MQLVAPVKARALVSPLHWTVQAVAPASHVRLHVEVHSKTQLDSDPHVAVLPSPIVTLQSAPSRHAYETLAPAVTSQLAISQLELELSPTVTMQREPG